MKGSKAKYITLRLVIGNATDYPGYFDFNYFVDVFCFCFFKVLFCSTNSCSIILNVDPSELHAIGYYYLIYGPGQQHDYYLEAFQRCRILNHKVDLWNQKLLAF